MAFAPVFGRVFPATFDRRAAVAAVPYSLYYDRSNDYVNCGTPASLMGLNGNAFTVDVYWQCPTSVPNWAYLILASQGQVAGGQGWTIRADFDGGGYYFQFAATLGNVAEIKSPAGRSIPVGLAWYYVRLRKTGAGNGSGNTVTFLSYNATSEGYSRSWQGDALSALPFYHGMNGAGNYLLKGNICYVHAWAVDKGALSTVPTAPFPVDADTRGRWIYNDGGGSIVSDSSTYLNHGTINGGAVWGTTVPTGWTI